MGSWLYHLYVMCFIGSPGPKVKPNTIKLLFVASPLNTQH